ncbi:MAG: acyl-CoA/acyl-ACP dehydrogenase [Chloroflexi bacterium]|jgi:3-oxocholest-4-en-26-oyl-CoA dehydrogenase beta subunit|nr:acyl-CoA/acyl-ACP dehydrogenase [Chloroflexota bacterium]
MDFSLTEEQQLLKNSARDFLNTECPKSVVRELEASESGHSPELWRKMSELGWMGLPLPEQYGGAEFSLLDLAILFEEIGRAAMPSPMFNNVVQGALPILDWGTEAQKSSLLPKVASGEMILTFAMAEPQVNYDARFVATKATLQGDGYSLSGTKLFVSYAHISDKILTVTRTSGSPGDEKGLTVFIVDAKASGVTVTQLENIAADKISEVVLDGVSVSSSDVLGKVDEGLAVVQSMLAKAAAIRCAEMVGGAQVEIEITADYTKTRHQFDRPIGTFQAVQHKLADMFIDVNGARWVTYQAIWRLTEGLSAERELAIAKAFTDIASQRIALGAQQLHAGIGFDKDYDIHFYYRRQKAFDLRLGTTAVHLATLADQI